MKKFHDIKIEATGQNIITVGDGNQVNVRYRDVAEGLASLRQAVMKRADLSEADKLNFVADMETMQSQLAKERPNHDVIRVVWENVKNVAVGVGLSADVATLAGLLAPLLL